MDRRRRKNGSSGYWPRGFCMRVVPGRSVTNSWAGCTRLRGWGQNNMWMKYWSIYNPATTTIKWNASSSLIVWWCSDVRSNFSTFWYTEARKYGEGGREGGVWGLEDKTESSLSMKADGGETILMWCEKWLAHNNKGGRVYKRLCRSWMVIGRISLGIFITSLNHHLSSLLRHHPNDESYG